MDRQSCLAQDCFATFEASPARDSEIRHCNRPGPDGGHVHRWEGEQWRVVVGGLEHDHH